jgi:hypothetical protein
MPAFLNATVKLGLGLYGAVFPSNPNFLAERVTDEVKTLTRWLVKRNANLTQSFALEVVVKALGFASWHEFRSQVQRLEALQSHSSRELRDRVIDQFAAAVPLLVGVERDMPPDQELQAALTALAKRIAVHSGVPEHGVLDVFARKYDARSWADFVGRRPETSSLPLYTFEVANDGDGIFRWSHACHALVDQLDGHFQRITDFSPAEQRKKIAAIRKMVAQRPDFLEAKFDLAYWETLHARTPLQVSRAFAAYEVVIGLANKHIPAGFRGQIPWGYIENRWYHRMLFDYMRLCADCMRYNVAIRFARRQLRQNKPDNLGVRFVLPALLLADGDIGKAVVASNRLRKDGRADALLLRGLCLIADGQADQGDQLLCRALFDLPMLRPLLLDKQVPDYRHDDRWHRGIIPDIKLTFWTAGVVFFARPDLHDHLRELFNRPAVRSAETELYGRYRRAAGAEIATIARGDLFEAWRQSCDQFATQLASGGYSGAI